MTGQTLYLLLADGILLLHVIFVVFVITGLVLIYAGWICHWPWVRNIWFRSLHLAAISIVVLQSWLGVICPLTTLEMMLRQKAGDATYSGAFIAHWLDSLLYYRAPDWVFVALYSLFGALVVVSWLVVKPGNSPPDERG